MAEEHTSRIEDALATATREQRWITAHQWALQAGTKINKAIALYESRLDEEALSLALEAIGRGQGTPGDPSNIDGFLVAAACLRRLGRPKDAMQLYEVQIKLLTTEEYRSSPNRYYQVLENLPPDISLLRMFMATLEKHISNWPPTPKTEEQTFSIMESLYRHRMFNGAIFLLRRLQSTQFRKKSLQVGCFIARELGRDGRIQDANELFQWLFEKSGVKAQSVEVACSTAKDYTNRGQTMAAYEILKIINGHRRTILGQAELMDVFAMLDEDSTSNLNHFVQDFDPVHAEWGDEDRIRELKSRVLSGTVKPETATRMIGALATRYAQCKDQIEQSIYQTALHEQTKIASRRWLMVAIFFMILILLTLIEGVILDFREDSSPHLGGFGAAILICYTISQLRRRWRMHREAPIELKKAYASRNQVFAELGLPLVSPLPVRSMALWRPFLLAAAGAGIYLFVWITSVMKEASVVSLK
jgi:tetratricopeptide (TPR) repeat protein